MNIGEWLRGLGLTRYETVFREHAIDMDVLADLTDGELVQIGLPLGDRKRVLKAIAGLSDGCIKIVAIATETATALFLAGTYGGASARLEGLTWGGEDLSAELGAETNRDSNGDFLDPYRLARALCLAGAAAARVQAIDTVTVDFRNVAALRRESEEARRDGFTGKMAIHPAQVPIINEVFTPSAAAVAQARAVIAAFEAQPNKGTVGIDGVMYDRPHLDRARQLLARAEAAGIG